MAESLIRFPTEWRARSDYPEDWQRDASCRGDTPLLYDNDEELSTPPIDVRCGLCPVRDHCFNYAMVYQLRGVWGGTTDAVRDYVRLHATKGNGAIVFDVTRSFADNTPSYDTEVTSIGAPTCPGCESVDVFLINHRERCQDCGISWPA